MTRKKYLSVITRRTIAIWSLMLLSTKWSPVSGIELDSDIPFSPLISNMDYLVLLHSVFVIRSSRDYHVELLRKWIELNGYLFQFNIPNLTLYILSLLANKKARECFTGLNNLNRWVKNYIPPSGSKLLTSSKDACPLAKASNRP